MSASDLRRLLFYVSGHGYGHVVRTGEIMRQLHQISPAWPMHVRTAAPENYFPPHVTVHRSAIDSGAVESGNVLTIDQDATVRAVAGILRERESIIEREVAFARDYGATLVVADIPYLAGDIADRCGIPCIALGNFTWSWIYEPILRESHVGRMMLQSIERSYSLVGTALRFPLHHDTGWEMIDRVVDVPFFVRSVQRNRDDVSRALGLQRNVKTRVLLGARGQLAQGTLSCAAAGCPEFQFLYFGPDEGASVDNVTRVELGPDLTFTDVLNASDLVLSKLGFSLLSECIALRKPVLYPPRTGFREDEVLETEVPTYLPTARISLDDFSGGNWNPHLRKLERSTDVSFKKKTDTTRTDGARVCAKLIDSLTT